MFAMADALHLGHDFILILAKFSSLVRVVDFIELSIAQIGYILHPVGHLILLSDESINLLIAAQLVVSQLLGQFYLLFMGTQLSSIFSQMPHMFILHLSNLVGPRVEINSRQSTMLVAAYHAAVAIASVALPHPAGEAFAAAVPPAPSKLAEAPHD